MRVLRWAGGIALLALGAVLGLLAPVAYVEVACRGGAVAAANPAPLLPPADRRAEARTLTTYPEWHIVHAYDDYAAVIAEGPPHDFAFTTAIAQFWGTTCDLFRAAPAHGGADWTARQTIHVIGVSFTAEMLLKGLYEESVGRLAHALGGRGATDDASARVEAEYAAFLRQTPWYRWDFGINAKEVGMAATDGLRDRERSMALRFEAMVKGRYARLIAAAVEATGGDAPTMVSVVEGADRAALEAIEGVEVVGESPGGVVIETPRYAAFTALLPAIAATGARFAEIAGNDEIMFTATGPAPLPGAFRAMPRQGYGDWRSLVLVPVGDLLDVASATPGLEHVHDY